MGQRDQCMHQGKLFSRYEIEGETPTITQTSCTTRYRNRDVPTVCVRWIGLHKVVYGDVEQVTDQSMTWDAGPKLGVTIIVNKVPEVPYTEQEKAAGRAHIIRVATQVAIDSGLWQTK